MLLPIKPTTTRALIFTALNEELGAFLHGCVDSPHFTEGLFTDQLRDAIWGNELTKSKFKNLWQAFQQLTLEERGQFAREFDNCQFIQRYYDDRTYPVPAIPPQISEEFDSLAKHLFSNTAGLIGVVTGCGETLYQYLKSFRDVNGNVCCFCGSSELVQYRAGVDVDEQWRAANDHLLAKDIYPIFSVHPDNLVPTCETCNGKAKLAKDLLVRKAVGRPDERRLCLYPLTEPVYEDVEIVVEQGEMGLETRTNFRTTDPDKLEKIDTWDDVYRIKERVEGKFIDLAVLVDSDCPSNDLDEFTETLRKKAISYLNNARVEGWNFWKARLYEWLHNHNDVLVQLWDNIQAKRADVDAAAVYGI